MSKPVLFVTGLGKNLDRAENIKALYESYAGDKVFLTTHEKDTYKEIKSGKYDLMVIDVFPTYSPGKAIMVWHAIQGGKFIGLGDRNTYYRAYHAPLMDRIVCAGTGAVEMWHKCTMVPESRIVPLGMPRTDRYIGKKKGDGGTPFADKRMYLFAPTFRGWNETRFPVIDWEYIDKELTDDEVMVVKSHPYHVPLNVPKKCRHVVEVSQFRTSANFLYDCDVVITDYSSIIFDGYLLGKPAVLFEKNSGYVKSRGMYLKYPEQYCSRFAVNEHQMIQLARTAKHLTRVETECMNLVADKCDGHSCERINKLINEMNKTGAY